MLRFPNRKLVGLCWMLFVPLVVFALQLLKAEAVECLTKCLSSESRAICVELLLNAVNRFDKILIKGHLDGYHNKPP